MTKLGIDPKDIPLPRAELLRPLWWAQDLLREALAGGHLAECPCCAGRVKVYSRALGKSMLKVLRVIARTPDGIDPAALTRQTAQQGDTGKLEAWGLAEKSEDDGRWRCTPLGYQWLGGLCRVPARVLLFHGGVLGFDHSREVHVADIDGGNAWDLERDVMDAEKVRTAQTEVDA